MANQLLFARIADSLESGAKMWRWDQGRLEYFQFDELRKIAKFALKHDLKAVDIKTISAAVGLPFSPDDPDYRPWRNYSRVFKLSMIATDDGEASKPTAIAKRLAADGQVTTDEYFHFLAQATTDPSPALQGWDHKADHRFPLLFALKFLLARAAMGLGETKIGQITAAYANTSLAGDEDHAAYSKIIKTQPLPAAQGTRQANESLRVLSQISYLSMAAKAITVSLDQNDAKKIFAQLQAVRGKRLQDGNDEIQRIAALFDSAIADVDFDYGHTVVSNTEEAGFAEGGRVERTHLQIERNAKLRQAFFKANPSAICDFCGKNTRKSFPWTDRVLDIHHILPLCSGTRSSKAGTVLEDLVAACPTCHRAVHRYYGQWLEKAGKKDFADAAQARAVYHEAKAKRGI